MGIVLKILYVVVSLFLLLFLESIFIHLFAFRIIFLVFLFANKKIDWRQLLVVTTIMSLIMDVTMHYKLGTNLLIFMIPLALFALFSMFSTVEDGIGSYIVRFFSIFLYYILHLTLPYFILSGTSGVINGRLTLFALINSLISILLLFLVNYVIGGVRKRGNTSQIRLK